MVRLILKVVVVFLLKVGVSQADYMDYHFKMHCDAASNRAEVVPYAIYNEDVFSTSPQDCAFANGRIVRAKMGLGAAYPYGAGGADPSKWLSVWVDKAKVFSRIPFRCDEEGSCSLRVIVTAEGVETCTKAASDVESSSKSEAPCEFTPNKALIKAKDVIEYPAGKDRRRPVEGALVTLFARDKNFCSQFSLRSSSRKLGDNFDSPAGLPAGAQPIAEESSFSYEYMGEYKKYSFDIDNDGTKESVIGLHSRMHYRDGDIYFVYADREVPDPPEAEMGVTGSEVIFAKSATQIIPHRWYDLAGTAERELADKNDDGRAYKVKSTSAPWWDSDDKPIFTFRYWHLWPFRYKDSTYFMAWSTESNKRHWVTVLRPEPNGRVAEMCVLQVVQARY
ncbi:hypothetical protein JVX91_20910 [Pseudomonas sp. PDNC002]|uniref:hypothetical protein n=1 Tax=Pseudomonas sp. PDNC002 TaxID=2811422 RepID=UPI00196483DC|nr:hypothetical protein [Pseudomonas sp. PDNC002]QRY78040.1 hypothetical protein JVX91_20910 [Pseudomonas sp. PDNC002]